MRIECALSQTDFEPDTNRIHFMSSVDRLLHSINARIITHMRKFIVQTQYTKHNEYVYGNTCA